MNTRRLRNTFLSALLVLNAGCHLPTDRQDTVSSLNFDYSGSRRGSFQAVGEMASDDLEVASTLEWATGSRVVDRGREYVVVVASVPVSPPGTHHFLQLFVPATGAGSYPVRAGGLDGVVFDLYKTFTQDPYFFRQGTITVTSLRENRIVGTFSGELEGNDGRTLRVSEGRFDVCVTYDGSGVRCGA
jgi:hypothetical protein